MRTFIVLCVLAIATSVSVAQFIDNGGILDERSKFQKQAVEPLAEWPYAKHEVYPAGKFIIEADNNGGLSFDTTLARNFQRVIDSIGFRYGVRGMSAAVLIPGQGTWLGTYGYSTIFSDSIRPETLFHITSQTKTFVSVLILKLVEEGRLSLNDTIGRWLPTVPPNIAGSITVRQLLNMTSGLFDYLSDSQLWYNTILGNPNRYWTPEEVLTTFVGAPHSPPGGPWYYSSTNTILAGMIIRNITGTNISTQLHQRILTPLSMTRTFLPLEDTLRGPIAHPWSNGTDFSFFYGPALYTSVWTAGTIYSTAHDMVHWMDALYGGQVLTPASLTQMQTCITEPPEWVLSGGGILEEAYGLGTIQYSHLGKRLWGHTGSFPGYQSMATYYPGQGVSVALCSNWRSGASSQWRRHIFESVATLYHEYLRTVATANANPTVVYAVSGGVDSARTYSLDTSSATLTRIGQYRYGEIVSCRVHPHTGKLYGLARCDLAPWGVDWRLVRIDGVNGEAFPSKVITFASPPSDVKGMAFKPDGTLYIGSSDGRLFTLDTETGAATQVASPGIPIAGLDFNPSTGQMWASVRSVLTDKDRIYKINLPSGDTTRVGTTGFGQHTTDIIFDRRGNLYGIIGSGTQVNLLARIDTTTAMGTAVGSLGISSLNALAFPLLSTAVFEATGLPRNLELEQNYPNPFNPNTTISYQLPGQSHVTLKIYDVLGREVATLVNGVEDPGYKSVQWEATGVASGVYFYRLEAGNFASVKKLTLLR